MAYLHGAYGQTYVSGSRVADTGGTGFIFVGTAPVHTVEGGAANVNVPVLCTSIADARRKLGYSDDWASYTLCEAMHYVLDEMGVGPVVLINVLDPAVHVEKEGGSPKTTTVSVTFVNGVGTISDAESAILDTLTVTGKTKGTDYNAVYNYQTKTIVISELTTGALTGTISCSYGTVDPTAVTSSDIIGTEEQAGLFTGMQAIKAVYQVTGLIPAWLLAPGWSSIPAVHNEMVKIAHKINNHWDAWVLADLPLTDNGTQITFATAATWAATNGYNKDNETVCFPMAEGTDGQTYHLSVLRAAAELRLLADNDDIPYHTASNTATPIVRNLYLGADFEGYVWDEEYVNKWLNRYGITSAAYVGGRWALWGAHAANYNADEGTPVNVSETAVQMLYYVSNDFQRRRILDVDVPMTANDLYTIVSEEQARLDALVRIGALTYGEAVLDSESLSGSDLMNGDFTFTFEVTTTPIAKSLTAIVNWTDQGFVTYFAEGGV